MGLTEKIELLGKGLYKNIPDELTLTSIPTASELEYVGSEDFDSTMINNILPNVIVEDIDVKELLEIDYQWILRALRILNYGPYHTTNGIFCEQCGKILNDGQYIVNLNSIGCKPLPEGFVNDVVISADEFIDFDEDIHISLLTVQQMLNAEKDKAFKSKDGRTLRDFARLCYMVKAIGNNSIVTPIDVKFTIQNKFTNADYKLLKYRVVELTDYGLRAGGETTCPVCGNKKAGFVAIADDRFFRPTVGDLQRWRDDKRRGRSKNVSRNASKDV